MKLSIITKIHFLNLVILSCLLLLVNIACENKLSKQGEEKVSTKKDDSSITTDQSSNVVVEVNGIILTQGEVDKKISRTLESMKGQFPRDQMENIKPNVRKEIIEDFITRTLLNQEADK
jgi:hypothetical protein